MCSCMEILTQPRQVQGIKGMIQYIETGWLLAPADDFDDGRSAPILRGLRETPSGRLTVTEAWIQISYCPICGEKIEGSPVQNWSIIEHDAKADD